MWNRQRLKRNARVLLKANYLKVVVVSKRSSKEQ